MARDVRPVKERFLAKIVPEPNSGCWLWDAALNTYGYGLFRGAERMVMAHRYSYEMSVGPIPQGLTLDHLCRVRCCVNPNHLEPVTRAENVRRGEAGKIQSDKTHCPHGHAYDEENTVWHKGWRSCRACERKRNTERRRAKGIKPRKFKKRSNIPIRRYEGTAP